MTVIKGFWRQDHAIMSQNFVYTLPLIGGNSKIYRLVQADRSQSSGFAQLSVP